MLEAITAVLLLALALAAPASAAPALDPGLCRPHHSRGQIPSSFAVQACFDGSTLYIYNNLDVALGVAVQGAVGKPKRTETDFEPAALATRKVSTDPHLLLPGDELRFPIGPGAAKVKLRGTPKIGYYAEARAFEAYVPGKSVGVIQAFTAMMKEVDQDTRQYATCETSRSRVHRAGCKALLARNISVAASRYIVHGLLAVARKLVGKVASLLVNTAELLRWAYEQPQQVKQILHSGVISLPAKAPAPAPSLGKAAQVSTDIWQSCAVLRTGGIACWGQNPHGELGDGTTTAHLTPALVHSLGPASAVSAGDFHTCAVLRSGPVDCWGFGHNGQLGNGTSVNVQATPVTVSGIGDATALAAGSIHTCAALRDGTARCWGWYGPGELGDGTSANSFTDTPVPVSSLRSAIGIAAAAGHSCAVIQDGSVQCWGNDYDGALGDGNSGIGQYSATPVQVVGLTNATSVAAASDHTCAVLGDGSVACWGANDSGQLGDGTTTDSSTPVTVAGVSDATSVSASLEFTCATRATGAVVCWGDNTSGELGDGTKTPRRTPAPVMKVSGALSVAAGAFHVCAVLSSGAVDCWGDNSDGALGDGTTTNRTTPVPVKKLG